MRRDELLAGRIDVLELLEALEDYILIKKDPSFPRYTPGSDIDLIVFDRNETVNRLARYYEEKIAPEGACKITTTNSHCYADFMWQEKLDLRIDIIDNFEWMRNIAVRPAYLTKLFLDRISIECEEKQIFVPSPEDDLTLRYFEYLEWFDRNPDKSKHLEYISGIEDENLKKRFYENTHRYMQFRHKIWNGPVPAKQSLPGQAVPRSGRDALGMISRASKYLVKATFRRLRSKF